MEEHRDAVLSPNVHVDGGIDGMKVEGYLQDVHGVDVRWKITGVII